MASESPDQPPLAPAEVSRGEVTQPGANENVATPGFLAIVSGPYAGTILPLSSGVTRVGRDGRLNDHVIDDDAVSELHLSIRFRDGVFILTDMDSENGTQVNSRPVEQQQLSPNDTILIGRTRLTFMQIPAVPETPG